MISDGNSVSTKQKTNNKAMTNHLFKKKENRFVEITIMTAGNKNVNEFFNLSHKDNAFMASILLHQCLNAIDIYKEYEKI